MSFDIGSSVGYGEHERQMVCSSNDMQGLFDGLVDDQSQHDSEALARSEDDDVGGLPPHFDAEASSASCEMPVVSTGFRLKPGRTLLGGLDRQGEAVHMEERGSPAGQKRTHSRISEMAHTPSETSLDFTSESKVCRAVPPNHKSSGCNIVVVKASDQTSVVQTLPANMSLPKARLVADVGTCMFALYEEGEVRDDLKKDLYNKDDFPVMEVVVRVSDSSSRVLDVFRVLLSCRHEKRTCDV